MFALVLTSACGDNATRPDLPGSLDLTRSWRSDDVPGCAIASPLLLQSQGEPILLTALTSGLIVATAPGDGHEVFRVALPAPDGQESHIAATPGVIGSHVLIANNLRDAGAGTRRAHQLVVLDLEQRALDPAYPAFELAASVPASDGSGDVTFLPANAYSRSAIATLPWGKAFVSFGNIQDIQPWHGWVFTIDLAAWQAGGDPIDDVLLTTPETDCGTPGMSGSLDMICGGGVWTPGGPTVVVHDEQAQSYDLFVATGNGQLDLGRNDYANSVLRVHDGVAFDPGCDPVACAAFDPIEPSRACMESCTDLFIPRLMPGDPPFDAPDGRCDGKSFFECYALLDWDLGANGVARVSVDGGADVLVVPAKDGGVYLVDAEHLGTLHDRLQLTAICGANGGSCAANWAGTMVTTPAVTAVAGVRTVIIPTFVFDHTNPAGLVALQITRDAAGKPFFTKLWEAPPFQSSEAVDRFREHVGRVALVSFDGVEYAALVDPGDEHTTDGLLYLVRVADGEIVERAPLDGPGRKYTLPVAQGDTLFTVSCDAEVGPSHLEAWTPRKEKP